MSLHNPYSISKDKKPMKFNTQIIDKIGFMRFSCESVTFNLVNPFKTDKAISLFQISITKLSYLTIHSKKPNQCPKTVASLREIKEPQNGRGEGLKFLLPSVKSFKHGVFATIV